MSLDFNSEEKSVLSILEEAGEADENYHNRLKNLILVGDVFQKMTAPEWEIFKLRSIGKSFNNIAVIIGRSKGFVVNHFNISVQIMTELPYK